jgi:hypothetical protein
MPYSVIGGLDGYEGLYYGVRTEATSMEVVYEMATSRSIAI